MKYGKEWLILILAWIVIIMGGHELYLMSHPSNQHKSYKCEVKIKDILDKITDELNKQ